jgi:hypothetical protein
MRTKFIEAILFPETSEANMLDVIDATNTIESVATDFTPETVESHHELGEAITNRWVAHANAKIMARATNEELRTIRTKLGEQLSEMKKLLAKPGCDGQWSGFLRERNIPRATADRLAARHLRSLGTDANRVTEEVLEPTDEDVRRLFIAVWPKLRRTLRSQQSVLLFVDLLTSHCQHSERPDREILVVTPTAATFDPPSSDEDSLVEPAFDFAPPPGPDRATICAS